ncbi:MAG TPA: hypothetical protein VK760_07965 [Candidatus Acidoferrales bacterium]|jgi:hypothetical protein|nr:hypothetical protein [Candidatus Acidoferrales bacterium]
MMVDDEHLPVPIPVAAPALADAPESSMLVEFGGKRLSGELRRSRGRQLRYALTVLNDAPLYLLMSFRVRRNGSEKSIDPGEMWMDPRSHADLSIAVPPLEGLLGGRLIVRLVNAKVHHELVAPLPGPSLLLGALGGAAATALLAFGFSFAHPHVDLFAVPPLGVAGAALQVPYQTGGVGAPSYVLEDERGAAVSSGALAAASGVLSLPLPSADRTRNYIVRLIDKGIFGAVDRAAPVTALPAPAPPQEQLIDAIGIDTSQIPDGGSFTLRYRTRATNGRVEVRDAQNRLWASAPIASNGISQMALPRFGKDKELRVTLEVERNGQRASSSVGLDVTGAAPSAPASQSDTAGAPASALTSSEAGIGSDGMLHVAVASGATNVRLALETTSGATIASQSVPAGATSAAIAIPRGVHGRVVLVTTYNRGSGEESTVKAIDVP